MTYLDPYCNQIVIVISAVKPDVISQTWFLRCHKVSTGQNVLICLFVHSLCERCHLVCKHLPTTSQVVVKIKYIILCLQFVLKFFKFHQCSVSSCVFAERCLQCNHGNWNAHFSTGCQVFADWSLGLCNSKLSLPSVLKMISQAIIIQL